MAEVASCSWTGQGSSCPKNHRYPYLEREDIQASLEYAAAQVDHAVLSLAK